MSKTLILIPSRLSAKRLPGKPLLKINGLSIIYNVYRRAQETKIGKVFVATGDKKIFDDVTKNGGNCIMTNRNHKTGTDRIFEAYKNTKLKNIDYILNIQGDEPMIDKNEIVKLNKKIIKNKSEIGTLACKIKSQKQLKDKNIVKVKTKRKIYSSRLSEADNFFRFQSKKNFNYIYHHIGIYLYKVETLKKFVKLKQTKNEKKFKLEQLRALENNIKIDVLLSKTAPIGIDTKAEYLKVKKILESKN